MPLFDALSVILILCMSKTFKNLLFINALNVNGKMYKL